MIKIDSDHLWTTEPADNDHEKAQWVTLYCPRDIRLVQYTQIPGLLIQLGVTLIQILCFVFTAMFSYAVFSVGIGSLLKTYQSKLGPNNFLVL